MLQFVPALLLLLLQGQTGVDRLSSHNGLPATLLALTAELDASRDAEREDRSMASLIALSRQNPSLSAVLIGILKSIQSEDCDLNGGSSDLSALSDESDSAAYAEPPHRLQNQALATVSRFRDGPALV